MDVLRYKNMVIGITSRKSYVDRVVFTVKLLEGRWSRAEEIVRLCDCGTDKDGELQPYSAPLKGTALIDTEDKTKAYITVFRG